MLNKKHQEAQRLSKARQHAAGKTRRRMKPVQPVATQQLRHLVANLTLSVPAKSSPYAATLFKHGRSLSPIRPNSSVSTHFLTRDNDLLPAAKRSDVDEAAEARRHAKTTLGNGAQDKPNARKSAEQRQNEILLSAEAGGPFAPDFESTVNVHSHPHGRPSMLFARTGVNASGVTRFSTCVCAQARVRACVSVCVHMCMHACMCVCVYVCMYVYIHTYIYVYVYRYRYMYSYTRTHTFILPFIHPHPQIFTTASGVTRTPDGPLAIPWLEPSDYLDTHPPPTEEVLRAACSTGHREQITVLLRRRAWVSAAELMALSAEHQMEEPSACLPLSSRQWATYCLACCREAIRDKRPAEALSLLRLSESSIDIDVRHASAHDRDSGGGGGSNNATALEGRGAAGGSSSPGSASTEPPPAPSLAAYYADIKALYYYARGKHRQALSWSSLALRREHPRNRRAVTTLSAHSAVLLARLGRYDQAFELLSVACDALSARVAVAKGPATATTERDQEDQARKDLHTLASAMIVSALLHLRRLSPVPAMRDALVAATLCRQALDAMPASEVAVGDESPANTEEAAAADVPGNTALLEASCASGHGELMQGIGLDWTNRTTNDEGSGPVQGSLTYEDDSDSTHSAESVPDAVTSASSIHGESPQRWRGTGAHAELERGFALWKEQPERFNKEEMAEMAPVSPLTKHRGGTCPRPRTLGGARGRARTSVGALRMLDMRANRVLGAARALAASQLKVRRSRVMSWSSHGLPSRIRVAERLLAADDAAPDELRRDTVLFVSLTSSPPAYARARAHTHTHTHTVSLSVCQSLSRIHMHTYTHTLSLSSSRSLSLTYVTT